MLPHFADLLVQSISKAGAPICVGLDPVLDRLPAALASLEPPQALLAFSQGVIDAITGIAPAIKFQSACYERHGSAGVASLEAAISHARAKGLVVILDAKRGDIGLSSEHYAASAVSAGAHAITVSGYLGPSGISPFLAAGLGVFVLVRTSNPDSDVIQAQPLADGRSVAELMADTVTHLGKAHLGAQGFSSVGAVVGATKAHEAQALRARLPHSFFLIPGYGAQGGTAADVQAMLTKSRGGILVTASRSVIYPTAKPSEDWRQTIHAAAVSFSREISQVVQG